MDPLDVLMEDDMRMVLSHLTSKEQKKLHWFQKGLVKLI